MSTSATLTARIKEQAAHLGFARVGVTPAVAPPGADHFREWLAAGYAGEMLYLAQRAEAHVDPARVLEGARSIVMLAYPYRTIEPTPVIPGQGRVARYAWGRDYHDVIRDKLHALADGIRAEHPDAQARGVIDTAPLAEREFAQLAGLGWIGKNTLLLNRELGSWFFLAAVLVDVELEYDLPHETDHCGTCRACLDACPTQAFVAPYVLDARRCISYLTIEHRSPVDALLREGQGEWLFGCDICQDVCPWNHKPTPRGEVDLMPHEGMNPPDLVALFALDEAAFRSRFRGSPLWRPHRRGLLRNAAIVLGNQRHVPAVESLTRGLTDEESLVRGACAWALGLIGNDAARQALRARLPHETDADVQGEIAAALSDAGVLPA